MFSMHSGIQMSFSHSATCLHLISARNRQVEHWQSGGSDDSMHMRSAETTFGWWVSLLFIALRLSARIYLRIEIKACLGTYEIWGFGVENLLADLSISCLSFHLYITSMRSLRWVFLNNQNMTFVAKTHSSFLLAYHWIWWKASLCSRTLRIF